MAIYPFNFVNRRGIAEIASTSVSASTTALTFVFAPHSFLGSGYRGLVLIHLPEVPAGTTGTLPVSFETNGVSVPLTRAGGDAVTAEDITGAGVYMVYYDKSSNTLQLLTGVI